MKIQQSMSSPCRSAIWNVHLNLFCCFLSIHFYLKQVIQSSGECKLPRSISVSVHKMNIYCLVGLVVCFLHFITIASNCSGSNNSTSPSHQKKKKNGKNRLAEHSVEKSEKFVHSNDTNNTKWFIHLELWVIKIFMRICLCNFRQSININDDDGVDATQMPLNAICRWKWFNLCITDSR